MGMTKVDEVGHVSIKKQARDGVLYLSYWSPVAKKILTKKLDSKNQNTARKEAAKLDKLLKGGVQHLLHPHRLTIEKALGDAIHASRSKSEDHRDNLTAWAKYFTDWLIKFKPGMKYWDEVAYETIEDYIEYQKERGLSVKAVQHYTSVLGITSHHWAKRNQKLYNRIEISHPWFSEAKVPVKNYLSAKQALDLLKFTRGRESPNAAITVALGAFAGLNLWEIARLRVSDVSLKEGTVEIRESKNKHRERHIPLHPIVINAIHKHIASRDGNEFLIVAPPGIEPTDATISRNLDRRLLPAAAKLFKCDAYLKIAPKDLRKTFANIMAAARVDELSMEAYLGHAAFSMLRKRYADSKMIEMLRDDVIKPVDIYLKTVLRKDKEFVTSRVSLIPDEWETWDEE